MNIPLDLVYRCLEAHHSHASNEEAESVLADWAEETGFGGLAAGLRADSPNVRWMVLADLTRMIDPSWLTKSHDMIEQAQRAYREAQLKGYLVARQSELVARQSENDVLVRDMHVRQYHENAARRSEILERSLHILSGLAAGHTHPTRSEDDTHIYPFGIDKDEP